MGWGRVIKSGIVGMLIFVPISYISFRFLNLTEGVTGGLIVNIDDAIGSLTSLIGFGGFFIELLAGALIGVVLVFAFPIHWCIMFRPEDWLLIIAITFPWILSCIITNALFSHSPRQAIHTSLSMGIGYAIISILIYIILVVAIPMGLGAVILDGLMIGLTEWPFLAAVLTAILEGCLVGTVFGAFIGSLRYKPKGAKEKKKKVKVKEEVAETTEMFPKETVEKKPISTSQSDYCTNCGAKLTTDDLFCTNCGSKR
ncbi:MAG: zinc ribbon domain-containing protein [Candidatus Thorarchaeota archaeon]